MSKYRVTLSIQRDKSSWMGGESVGSPEVKLDVYKRLTEKGCKQQFSSKNTEHSSMGVEGKRGDSYFY